MRRKIQFATGSVYHVYSRGVRKSDIFIQESDYLRWQQLLSWSARYDYSLSLYLTRRSQLSLSGNDIGVLDARIDRDYKLESPLVHILSYVSMSNHFHLLVEQNTDNGISLYMQKLLTAYSKYLNIKYKLTGAVFEGRFHAALIRDEAHFIQIQKYILRNPLAAKLVNQKTLLDYRWSAVQEYLNPDKCKIITMDRISKSLSNPSKLRRFILDGSDDNI